MVRVPQRQTHSDALELASQLLQSQTMLRENCEALGVADQVRAPGASCSYEET